MKNQSRTAVANSMRKEAEKELTNLSEKPNHIFKIIKFMKKNGKDIEAGRCMRGKDGKLSFSKKQKRK